jgi:hypothetical protein
MSRKAGFSILLFLAALVVVPPGTLAEDLTQTRCVTPLQVSGSHTPDGICLVCRHPDYPFTLELRGKKIVPLSSERLRWRIDRRNIELFVCQQGAGLPLSASDIEVLRDYSDHPDGPQQLGIDTSAMENFSSPSGKKVMVWRERQLRSEDYRILAAVRNGGYVIVLAADQVSQKAEQGVRDYLKKTLFTLGKVAEVERKNKGTDIMKTGMKVQDQIRWQEALLEEPCVAVLNGKLATSVDRSVPGVLALEPGALIELTRIILDSGQGPITVSVYDGRVAHAINLHQFVSADSVFLYWDPWGKGSFLEKANNAAEVNARAHPTEKRMWMLKYDELERILYSVVQPEQDLIAALRTCTLLDGLPRDAISTYRALYSQDNKSHEIAPERLSGLTRHFVEDGDNRSAITLLSIQWALRPPSPKTLQETLAPFQVASKQDAEKRARELIADADEAQVSRNVAPHMHLAEAIKKDFFTFFFLTKISSESNPDGHCLVRFRPSNPHFRELVEVKLILEQDESIIAQELSVAREFINHPMDGIFARDLVKSFLQFAVPASDLTYVQPLITEIRHPSRDEVEIPSTRRPGSKVPAIPSLAYMTFLGTHPKFIKTLPSTTLSLRNMETNGSHMLVLSVTGR